MEINMYRYQVVVDVSKRTHQYNYNAVRIIWKILNKYKVSRLCIVVYYQLCTEICMSSHTYIHILKAVNIEAQLDLVAAFVYYCEFHNKCTKLQN